MAAGNTELCELVDVEPKSQCIACLMYWSAGIENCTCGHFMKDYTTENKEYISSMSGRAGHTVTGTGRKQVAQNSTRQNNFKEGVERNDTKTFTIDFSVIELGHSEEVIFEMDRLASEDHSHRSNEVDSDTMPIRHRLDFKKALSILHRLKKT